MTSHLTGALAAIIADPDCCAASKAIARAGLNGVSFDEQPVSAKVVEALRWALAELNGKTRYVNGDQFESCMLSAEAALAEMVATAQAAGEYSEKAHNPLVSDFAHKERPVEPADLGKLGAGVWYRGWECGWDEMAAYWTGDGYFAALGGADADCIHVRASTWNDLLDEIDDHDKTECGA